MSDKPELIVYNSKPVYDLPKESFEDFRRWVLEGGLKPSAALQKIMEKYSYPKPHVFAIIDLLTAAYPDIDMGRTNLSFKIQDSAYPGGDPNQFSDEDFDKSIEELLSLPPVEW